MNKKTWYDQEEDILNMQISRESYCKTVELSQGVHFDIAKNGKIIAIEIINASKVFRNSKKVLERAQI